MPSSRHLIFFTVTVAGCSLIGIVINLMQPPAHEGLGHDSYGTRWYGERGLYELLKELNVPVARALTPTDPAHMHATTYVLLAPDPDRVYLESGYIFQIADWVKQGGLLILAAPHLGGTRRDPQLAYAHRDQEETPPSDEDELTSRTGQMLSRLGLPGISLVSEPLPSPSKDIPWNELTLNNAGLQVSVKKPEMGQMHANFDGNLLPLAAFAGDVMLPKRGLQTIRFTTVTTVTAPRALGRMTVIRDAKTTGLLMASFDIGHGRIALVSDPVVFENALLREAGNSALAAHLIAGTGGPVIFDEFYHGLTVRGNPFWLLTKFPFNILALMIAFTWAVWTWRAALHLGPPRPDPAPIRRSVTEYVEAMANLFARGRVRPFIGEELRQGVLWHFRRQLGLKPEAEKSEVIRRLAQRDPAAAAALEAALDDLAATLAGRIRPESKAFIQSSGKVTACLFTNFIKPSAVKSRK